MSIEQEQRTVNQYDKEIAELEKKKAVYDKKCADEQKRAASIAIPKNASPSLLQSKNKEIQKHRDETMKATEESAKLQKKISETRTKRNAAYIKLQKTEESERKKQVRVINDLKRSYEVRIAELEAQRIQTLSSSATESEVDDGVEFDVFVSHAWEDKESFVDEFVVALQNRGINPWYDKQQIKWGDSMRARIEEGLKKSRFGIVVLSPNYIAEGKYWTKTELDGLFQIESINGKSILPIWHNLTKKEVMAYSPIIASKLAMTTALMTADEIADELSKLLQGT